MERRRSTRLQAIHNATNEEVTVAVSEAGNPKATTRKRSSPKNVEAPPNRRRRSSLQLVDAIKKKEEATGKPQKKVRSRVVSNKLDDFPDLPAENLNESGGENEMPAENKEEAMEITNEQKPMIYESQIANIEAPSDDKEFLKDRSSSMETFEADSDAEVQKKKKAKLPPRPPSRNLPRRSHATVVSYKESRRDSIDSSESDISCSSDSEDAFEDEEIYKNNKTKRIVKTKKRKHEESTEEYSSDEEDDNEPDEEEDDLMDGETPVKRKAQRRSGSRRGGSGSKKTTLKTNTGAKGTSRRSSIGVKTPVNRPIKPWEKQTGNVIKHKVGDIIVPPRPLRRGEQKMLVFRILANQLALERKEEISLSEGYRLLDTIKAEYNVDKEGYIRRVLMTGGRDPDDAMEKEEEKPEKKENDGETSSSEDEWMEMEPVEAEQRKKLEVVLEDREASGYDWWAVYLRQEVNKKIRQKYEDSHKVNILCYLAHLEHIVKVVLHEQTVPSLLLSQLPEKLMVLQGETITKETAQQVAMWFKTNYKSSLNHIISGTISLSDEVEHYSKLAGEKCYTTDMERSALLFALFVGLGCIARICVNTRPIPRRWGDETKSTSVKNTKDTEKKEKSKGRTSSEGSKKAKATEMDYWVEYWDTQENRWICINPVSAKVDDPLEIEQATHSQIYYIFAVDNKRGIRDVSARYASDFCRTDFRRRRTEGPWLTRTLNCDVVKADENRAKLEDIHFKTEMVGRPLPVTISEYKNHPLYVLERDLLKFQALYPPPSQQKPLGNVRGHNVYPRSTVHTLLGEKKWEKLARSIKEGEQPYKIVKAFPNFRVPKEERVDAMLNVYGYWQTEPFRPLKVEDGIIPRNEYGNVYMYQPSMCPIGAVHLRLPGLVALARRLGRECVPAITGWDFNHCGNWPIIEGACVLAEDEDLFVEEWRKAEIEREKRDKKKREDRALKNWKKFIQGMIRLHRVKTKFGHPVEEQPKKKAKSKKDKEPTPEPVTSIIDNTEQPTVKQYSLHDVMGI